MLLALGVALAGCVRPQQQASGGGASQHLEVRCFEGGYGIDFFEQAAREYEQQHPGVTISLQGDARIWEQLRPQFVAGTPPDLAYPGWGMDHYALIYEQQVIPWDPYLDEALPRGETWRSTFKPEILKLGEYEGRTYLMPYFVTLYGWWYNVNLFEANGWSPPTTWDELLALCARIKAKGIAPLTYQGQYPYYAIQGFLLPWAISTGGRQAFIDAENLQPGAWTSPAMLRGAEMIDELRRRGYFQAGAGGMSHTEAQMEFLQGNAAMIPCGTWLKSEMETKMPPGFRMAFFLPPAAPNPVGDPSTVQVNTEPWVIARASSNPALAADFYRYMTSVEKAQQFVTEKGTLMAVVGSDDTTLPAELVEPARILREAQSTWTPEYTKWYQPLETEFRNAVAALMLGGISPRACMERVEKQAQGIRNDPNVPKHVAE